MPHIFKKTVAPKKGQSLQQLKKACEELKLNQHIKDYEVNNFLHVIFLSGYKRRALEEAYTMIKTQTWQKTIKK
jgi:hypothetical protein